MRRTVLCAVAYLLVACHSDSPTTPGGVGDSCGATHGCADGLTCHAGSCEALFDAAVTHADAAVTHADAAAGPDAQLSDASLLPDAHPADAGSCGPCDTPPDACHARIGTCSGSTCSYAFVEGATCDDGNSCTVADTCTNNGCFGTPMTCTTPPAGVCLSGSEAKTYDAEGTCTGGLCVYQSHTVTCGDGECAAGACQTNSCAGVVCDTPPSACYLATGACAGGSCSYGYNDGTGCDDGNACTANDQCNTGVCKGTPKLCGTPPANTCANANTLKAYAPIGACAPADGTCSYTYSFVSCPGGCAGGMCNPSGWQVMTSNTTKELYSVWGSSASAVWAIGQQGTMVFYNGAQWQVRATPAAALNHDLYLIDGTAADNVFIIGNTTLLRFDGAKWNVVVDLSKTTGPSYITGLHATGDASNDVYVSTMSYVSGSPFPTLYIVDGSGTLTKLGSDQDPDGSECYTPSGAVWSFSSTDVLFAGCRVREWDGAMVSVLGGASQPMFLGAQRLWATSPSAVLGLGYTSFGASGDQVALWDGAQWTVTPSGLNGALDDLWGTAPNRVFFAGYDSTHDTGTVLYYDGLGFTAQVLPPEETEWLHGIWAAPTGEVFAVGSSGRIITGP